MEFRELKTCDGRDIAVKEGTVLYDIVKNYNFQKDIPVVLGKINNKYYELTSEVHTDGIFKEVDISEDMGFRTYVRTLQFVFIKAALDLFPKCKVVIEHSLNKGTFGEIHKENVLCKEDISAIKERMQQIINEDIPIRKIRITREEAIDIFKKYGMEDKIKLMNHINNEFVKLYELNGTYDYFYGSMAYSTGVLKVFDLICYGTGFLLRYPDIQDPLHLPEYVDNKKLGKIFYESEKWGEILETQDVGSLNDKVANNEIVDIIRVSEALHEKKIAYIADMISERKNVKIVLISGPSSSGKTTFARRLGIQLRVNGLLPIPISLDDYFVDREYTPKDEKGEYDFESIHALDLKLFNENLAFLLEGNETELPTFNFKKGVREWKGDKIKLPQNGILIVEGIHGLNEMLTSSIPAENKFKIYISALTQLNLDNHNRIATTDVRIIRRIVRDHLSRGYSAESTLKMWPSIRRGEEKNIFVYQENANAMFNSTLVYELCILKKYALYELEEIEEDSPVYYEALRLKSFLHFFKDVNMDKVPENSILREFIGGSCFYEY